MFLAAARRARATAAASLSIAMDPGQLEFDSDTGRTTPTLLCGGQPYARKSSTPFSLCSSSTRRKGVMMPAALDQMPSS
eukprot:4828064-Prymnesium_polylepis.1